MPARRYTDEQLLQAWADTGTLAGTGRQVGLSVGGRSARQLADRLIGLGVDVSSASRPRVLYDPDVLAEAASVSHSVAEVVRRIGAKSTGGTQAHIGRRLKSLGTDTNHFSGQAHMLGTDVWNGAPLRLHVDHVNGDWLDNRPANLRFLCPNCHSQTATFGRRTAPTVEP